MRSDELLPMIRRWVPFASRTVGYGMISCVAGPLSPERRVSTWAMRRWCIESCKGLGIHVEVEGLDRVPDGPCVYAANHQSVLDILVLGSVLPGDFKWVAKRSLMRIPFLGWHLMLAGHIPIDRSRRSQRGVTDRFLGVLAAGKRLLIFPEGTRSPDGAIHGFKNGGFVAAVRAGVPVVPVVLDGTFHMMRKGEPDAAGLRRDARVRVLAPLQPRADLAGEAERVTELRDRARALMVEAHVALGGKGAVEAREPAAPPAVPVADEVVAA